MGTPSPGWDSLVLQTRVAARRRKRRRRARRMLWLLTVATTAALVVIAVFIMRISKIQTARPAALKASARTVSHGNTPGKTHQGRSQRHHPPAVTYPRVTDAFLCFPPLVFILAVTAYMGQSVANITLVIGVLSIPAFTRVARAVTLSLTEREFVVAARALGATHSRILLRELLPNVALPLVAFFLLGVAVTIVVEGALSFLGLGVPPPAPSWGSMIAEGRESLDIAPWLAFLPAIFMFLSVLAFNIVGDTLRALTDPRPGAL